MDASRDGDEAGRRRVIVVGIDGSPGSYAALAWALDAAATTGAPVEALTAFPVDLSWANVGLADPGWVDAVQADLRVRVAAMVDEARAAMSAAGGTAPDVDLVVVPGAAAQQLVQRSGEAALLVVGSRGRGGVTSTVLGSVALHCAVHARCPVVVVHPATPNPEPRVVVGLDDSVMSREALRRGADEALRLGARLDVVVAFQPYDSWSERYQAMVPPWGETREHAEGRARTTVSEVLGEEARRLTVGVVAEDGVPGDVLVRAAEGARLLVVGSLSRSRLEGMLLGSVALHCVVHAPCPVMVVRPQRTAVHAGAPPASAPMAGMPPTPVG